MRSAEHWRCPHCGRDLREWLSIHASRYMGALGTGEKKRRTAEQARAAARVRWGRKVGGGG